ncbi:MAG: sulfatase-like hydrolase/transferase [Planctomycetia bacterium]|nr:sulfatase-like hydrolase/transferase [Planctomycetia bacterium]
MDSHFCGTSSHALQQATAHRKKWSISTVCLLFLLLAGLPQRDPVTAAEAKLRPNVLFLFADDMRADSIAAFGNTTVKTPNLDALVRRGFAMRNAYCFGGNSAAVCTPSRNMLLSGNAYFRWKDFVPPGMKNARPGGQAPGDGPNFPLAMRDAGYLTYHHGKKGNTAPLIQAKFEINKYLKDDEAERLSGEPGREIVDEAISFLRDQQGSAAKTADSKAADSRPFCMYLAFGNPHDPRVAAKKYLDQYEVDQIPLPKNYRPVHPFDNGEMTVRDEKLLSWPRTETDVRRTLHEYYATITAMDYHIGRLLESLKELRQLDNTLIVFSADQGIAVGSHGLLGKQNLYDAAMKSPLIFAGPGIKSGESQALVHLFDIMPTICGLVGANVPEKIDGRSFRPVLDGKAKSARPELMLAYLDKQRAFRDERWKLIRYPQVNITQLFDLQADPDEMHNLADEPTQKERVAAMLMRLAKLQQHFADDLPLTVRNPKSAAWVPPGN